MEDFEKLENSEIDAEKTEPENTEVEAVETETALEPVANEEAASDNISDNTESVESVVDEVSEPDGESAPAVTDLIPKKKSVIQKPLIIAACILVIALIVAGVYYFFFNNSIEGTWALSEKTTTTVDTKSTATEQKEITRYFTFNKDGVLTISFGTVQINGEWKYSTDDSSTPDEGKKYITITVSGGMATPYEYSIEGNAFTGKTLTLKAKTAAQSAAQKLKSASVTTPELSVSKDFKAVKGITGSWNYKDVYKNNNIYTFNADGTCSVVVDSLQGKITTNGVYKVDTKKKNIKVTYYDDSKKDTDIPYKLGKKSTELTLFDAKFTKAK